jgi:hypothetical protein
MGDLWERGDSVTVPLILQIQEDALDSKASLTDALRKAKIACTKLDLIEFGNWLDLELNGYVNTPVQQLPEYRKIYGFPEWHNPYHGWQPIIFPNSKAAEICSCAPISMSVAAIEESLRNAPYPPDLASKILGGKRESIHIKLTSSSLSDILNYVRNIVINWTVDMEKQGVLGDNLIFSPEDRAKSATLTAQTVTNHIHISQVGSFVQNADRSVVQGVVGSTLDLEGVKELLQQIEPLLPASNIAVPVKEATEDVLDELKSEAGKQNPDSSRLRILLESLKRVLAPAGDHLVRIAVDSAITKLLGP